MILRAVIPTDLPIFYADQRDPVALEMAAFESRDHDAFMAHWNNTVLVTPTSVTRTILHEDQVAGWIVTFENEGKIWVGYWISRAFWGRGIASAALAEYLLRHEPRRPLHASIAVHNKGSRRVVEKCGFMTLGPPRIWKDSIEEIDYRLDG